MVETYTADGLIGSSSRRSRAAPISGSVSIGFSGTAPRRLELVDGLGQVTRIELDNLDVNPELADRLFELEVPAGVDVIGGEG